MHLSRIHKVQFLKHIILQRASNRLSGLRRRGIHDEDTLVVGA